MGTCNLTCGHPPDAKELITNPDDILTDKDYNKTVNTKETSNPKEQTTNPHYLGANNLNLSEYFGPNHEQSEIKDPIMPSNNISAIEPNGNSVYIGMEERNELIKLVQIDSGDNNKNAKPKKKKSNKKYKGVYNTKNKMMNSVNSNSNNKGRKKESKK